MPTAYDGRHCLFCDAPLIIGGRPKGGRPSEYCNAACNEAAKGLEAMEAGFKAILKPFEEKISAQRAEAAAPLIALLDAHRDQLLLWSSPRGDGSIIRRPKSKRRAGQETPKRRLWTWAKGFTSATARPEHTEIALGYVRQALGLPHEPRTWPDPLTRAERQRLIVLRGRMWTLGNEINYIGVPVQMAGNNPRKRRSGWRGLQPSG